MSRFTKNFEWQFDPRIFNTVVDQRGIANPHGLSTQLSSFARGVIHDIYADQDGPVPSSVLPASDIHEFAELLALVVDRKQDLEGVPEIDRMEVRECYSDIRPERDTLCWHVKERRPGLFASGKIGSKHVQEYSMHLRAVFDDPFNAGHSIAAFGKKMDNWIKLCIYSADATSANRRAMWVEETLEQARWIFQYNGFERVLFQQRQEDTFEEIASNRFHGRPLVYFVRTEKIVLHRVALLKKLIFDLCVAPPGMKSEEAVKLNTTVLK